MPPEKFAFFVHVFDKVLLCDSIELILWPSFGTRQKNSKKSEIQERYKFKSDNYYERQKRHNINTLQTYNLLNFH